MTVKSVKLLHFLFLVNVSADRNKLLGGQTWPISIRFLEMLSVVFWIGVHASYEFLLYITVINCKNSSLVSDLSSCFFWASVTVEPIKF